MKDKNEYKRQMYKQTLGKYKEAKTRIEKKEIKNNLYKDPYLTEYQKNEIWREIIELEYLSER